MARNKLGGLIHVRRRNYYESKILAEADRPRLHEQNDSSGSGSFFFDPVAADDYETALKLTGGVRIVELVKFWLRYHPDKPKRKLAELCEQFLNELKSRNGDSHHYREVKPRCTLFIKSGCGDRYADTVTRHHRIPNTHGVHADSLQIARHEPFRNGEMSACP